MMLTEIRPWGGQTAVAHRDRAVADGRRLVEGVLG